MIARLVTGLALTFLIAYAGYVYERQGILAKLGSGVAGVMLAHGVEDGAAGWTDARGATWRTARLSGTADAGTRRRVIAAVERLPGVHGAVWR